MLRCHGKHRPFATAWPRAHEPVMHKTRCKRRTGGAPLVASVARPTVRDAPPVQLRFPTGRCCISGSTFTPARATKWTNHPQRELRQDSAARMRVSFLPRLRIRAACRVPCRVPRVGPQVQRGPADGDRPRALDELVGPSALLALPACTVDEPRCMPASIHMPTPNRSMERPASSTQTPPPRPRAHRSETLRRSMQGCIRSRAGARLHVGWQTPSPSMRIPASRACRPA
jgi:hypothetical protein